MKIPTPKEYCDAYFRRVYDEGPLTNDQQVEVTLAFHAGIEAACKFMMEDFMSDNENDDEVLSKRLAKFRVRNTTQALHINMARFNEGQNEKLN